MTRRDRRLGYRIPFQGLLTSFIRDRPVRALAADLSDTGIRLHTTNALAPAPGTAVVLELALPGADDTIWCAGEVCYREADELASGLGVRFVTMARLHARVLRDYCIESRRSHLGGLLARIRGEASPGLAVAAAL
jgi:c-di-GMP-binding flagellar brake protein YcgR